MRRLLLLTASTLAFSALTQQTSLPTPLKRSFDVLGKAKSLTILGTLQTADAEPAPITIQLSKPDKFRVETPDAITVSDGGTYTRYLKASNTYDQSPTPEFMPDEFFGREEVAAYGAFFSKKPGSDYKSAAATPAVKVGGYDTDGVVVTPAVGGSMSFLIDRKLGVVRRAIVLRRGEATIVEAKTIKLGDAPLPASTFKFTPPAGAVKKEPAPIVAFASVKPLIDDRCMPCHGGDKPRAGVKLDTYEGVLATVVPGDPKASLLVKSIKGQGVRKMPLGNHPALTPEEIKVWEDWISSGAKNG